MIGGNLTVKGRITVRTRQGDAVRVIGGGILINGDLSAAGGRDGITADGEIRVSGGNVKASGRNHGLWGSVVTIGDGIGSLIASGDWAITGSDRLVLEPQVKIIDPEEGRINDEGTNIIGPDGFFATRIELAGAGGEAEPDTETETAAPETETETAAPETETETAAPETET